MVSDRDKLAEGELDLSRSDHLLLIAFSFLSFTRGMAVFIVLMSSFSLLLSLAYGFADGFVLSTLALVLGLIIMIASAMLLKRLFKGAIADVGDPERAVEAPKGAESPPDASGEV